jgi:hypothetical protein
MAAMFHPTRRVASFQSLAEAVTTIAAFYEGTKEIHAEVSDTIRRIISLEQQARWTDLACRELTSQLQQLQELIELSFSLEETYGYFENPLFAQAGYGNRMSDLGREHKDLSAGLSRLCDYASRLWINGGLPNCADTIMARFYAFCDQLAVHELREKELITEAFSVDVGCGD